MMMFDLPRSIIRTERTPADSNNDNTRRAPPSFPERAGRAHRNDPRGRVLNVRGAIDRRLLPLLAPIVRPTSTAAHSGVRLPPQVAGAVDRLAHLLCLPARHEGAPSDPGQEEWHEDH